MLFRTHLWLAQAEVSPEISSPGFSLQPIGQDFVINFIKRIRPNKATGPDKISARLLKYSVHPIAPSLTMLFNLALQTGSFPSTRKGCTLHKKGDRQNPSNYSAPISILPTLSTIIERAVHTQFHGYLTENHLISSK